MSTSKQDAAPFAQFKSMQREMWAGFGANEGFTTMIAGDLVTFAQIAPGESVLDVGCGTGVVAVTAARAGARVRGLDLTPALLERARENAVLADVEIEFMEGDVESLPYPDRTFDVVLSQFGHMFAPRPELATSEMLRVLKPGGRIAFSTWPPEHAMGGLFSIMGRATPAPPPGAPAAAPPPQWGDPNIVRARLGEAVTKLRFSRSSMNIPALSPKHVLLSIEATFGPLKTLLARLDEQHPEQAHALRSEILQLIRDNTEGNVLRQFYLLSQATKKDPA